MKLEQQRELKPNEIIEQAIDQGLTDFYVGYSGGKDSGIVLDLMAKNFQEYFKGVLFINTGIGTQQTIDFVRKYCKQRKYPLFFTKPEDVKRVKKGKYGKIGDVFSYSSLVESKGFPKEGLHTTTMRVLKYFPMRKFIKDRIALGEKPCIVSGVRKNESARRKIKWNSYLYNDGKMWFVSPIFFKSNKWVYQYFIENNIKRSPVYETLHISGDCLCGCFAKKEELKLVEMFHPDVFKKIKDLENKIKEKGTKEAKKYPLWGNGNNTTHDIESQTTMESFVCNDCILDRSTTDDDTKKFNDELESIEAKLEGMNEPIT